MENNNKKIVIKKILSKEFKNISEQNFEEEVLDNKIDDKFFEPINEDNIDAILKELRKTKIQYDTIKTRLSEEELQKAGIVLAKRIFELAQPRRETRDSLYLNAFNVVLESYRVSDQYRILQAAHQFFLNEYRDYMETRGERPGILSQIIRRVGKENQEKYRHIVNGVNLEKVGQSIFDILNDEDGFKKERIKNLLFGNSKNEISAIRSKINILHIDVLCQKLSNYIVNYKELNKKNEDILFELFADKEEYKKYFYTYTSPEEAIYYLLSGRDTKELTLIEERYNKYRKKEDAFKNDLEIVFKNTPTTKELILNGLNYEKIALKIKNILYPENEKSLGAELPYTGIYHKENFNVKLEQVNLLKDIKSHKQRQLHQREKILQEFSFLKGDKAKKLNTTLDKLYKISLDPEIFPEMFLFDPQQIAFNVNNALFLRREPSDIIKIIRYYNINELNQIKKAYLVNFNSSLESDICDYSMKALKGKFTEQTKNAFCDIISGVPRLDSKFDLIEYLLKNNSEFSIWDAEYMFSPQMTDSAYGIAEIINNETYSFDEIESELAKFLKKFSYNELSEIKQIFYSLLEPKESFTKINIDVLGDEKALNIDKIINNFEQLPVNKLLIPYSLLSLQENFAKNNLPSLKEKMIEKGKDLNELDDLAPIVENYACYLVRTFYTHKLRQDNANEFVTEAFDLEYKYIKTIEYIFNIKFSSLRRLFKEMINSKILSNDIFATIILKLEDIPIGIINDIKFYINQKKLRDLLKILSKYTNQQKIFEDLFEVITLDTEVTSPKLKQLIKDSQSKLTDINECILYIDGYYPKELAKKIRRILVQNTLENKNNLGQIKKDLTSLFLGISNTELIPEDINWKIEQNYIATLYYKALFKEHIIASFRKIKLEQKDIIDLANLIYGEEIVSQALVLEEIVSDQIIDEQELNTLKQIIPLRHKRFMMILREFFNGFTIYNKKLEDYVNENEEVRKIFTLSD